jgi:CHAT domain-containing protein
MSRVGAHQHPSFWKMRTVMMLLFLASGACSRQHDPQRAFDHALATLNSGDAAAAAAEAEKGYRKFNGAAGDWRWKFAVLRARALYRRGMYDQVLTLLASEPGEPASAALVVRKKWIEGLALTSLDRFAEAEQKFKETEPLCKPADSPACADVATARGNLEMQRGRFAEAQSYFESVFLAARSANDPFWESNALLDLSWSALEQTHFDEALDWAGAAQETARSRGFDGVAEPALGNMGWAYYKLGDLEKASEAFASALGQAKKLGDVADEVKWLTDLGYVRMDSDELEMAKYSFADSLRLAQQIDSREDVIGSLIALAFVSEQTGKFDDARRYADQALAMAPTNGNRRDVIYPKLVEGQIAAHSRDIPTAEAAFREVDKSPDTPVFLKWEAERSLARLYEDENQTQADAEYRTALTTFEAARCDLHQRVDSRLPFLSNAAHIYEDYIHFLVSRGQIDDALRVADYARGRTLAEGLGRTCKPLFAPDPLNAPEIARHAGGTVLFYALGQEHSYLWAITPGEVRLFPLTANRSEIDAAVERYRKKIEGPPEILEASDEGNVLYRMLVAPAQDLLKREVARGNDSVFIIPDSGLNSLNFETLLPAPKHYWIEDATIVNTASLRLLSAAHGGGTNLSGKLLLIGNPVAPQASSDSAYPELPNAAAQMENIEKYFPPERQEVFARNQASPEAYLGNHPEQFSYIHFVAHGTASRESPLDSAIILSRGRESSAAAGQDDSFKLYARDIIGTHRLRAELVTISACYSTGKRTYSGEGLVGLSWAFLRAGAHNVIAALWDVSDASAPQLVDAFYGELKRGRSPGVALRSAKLSLLHSAEFRGPFYWAPFQLYTGSQ